jgi:hypothetical protein
MMRVAVPKEPDDFEDRVRAPGRRLLQTMNRRRERCGEIPRGWTLLVRDCPLVAREYLRQGGTAP